MYGHMSYNHSTTALDDFYRLFLVPGGGHCNSNPLQPGGGWPQTTLQTVINWVEKDVAPDTLANIGPIEKLCRWPLRPTWRNGVQSCVYDQESIDTWMYDFSAYISPLY